MCVVSAEHASGAFLVSSYGRAAAAAVARSTSSSGVASIVSALCQLGNEKRREEKKRGKKRKEKRRGKKRKEKRRGKKRKEKREEKKADWVEMNRWVA